MTRLADQAVMVFGFAVVLGLSAGNTILAEMLSRDKILRGDPSSTILVIEVVKLLLVLAYVGGMSPARFLEAVFVRGWRYSVPALLYLGMNTTVVAMVSELGALSAVLVLNLKIPFTGLLAYLLLGRALSLAQVGALLGLTAGAVLSQLKAEVSLGVLGLAWGAAYGLLSGLSGVFTEKLLQEKGESLSVQQVQLYAWGCMANVLVVMVRGYHPPGDWTHPLVVAMFVCQVCSGFVTAWLIRTQGSFARVFLHSLVGICVAGYEYFAVRDSEFNPLQIYALALVTLSLFVFHHFQARPNPKKKTQ